ncbi:hypothetical protein [Cytobacillus citreus]|nr:hypothetical protein [Cytobacillus citreus]
MAINEKNAVTNMIDLLVKNGQKAMKEFQNYDQDGFLYFVYYE